MKKKLFTLTGPSCSGKTTLVRKLLQTGEFCEVVSFTSRQPRGGEINGVDYYFQTPVICEGWVNAGMTAEAIKFKDNWYGILKQEIDNRFASGKTPIVIVEPKGLEQLSKNYSCFVTYIDAPLEVLYTRFLSRLMKTESPNLTYEARRIASIYLEQKEWPDMVSRVTGIDFGTTFMEGHEQSVIDHLVEMNKYHNTLE